MSDLLLSTKLFAPRRGRQTIARRALTEKFAAGLSGALTLVSAPAGFGKTTLVAEWYAACAPGDRPHLAWVSLDAGDNEPVDFWRYVFAAVAEGLEGRAEALGALLDQPDPPLRRFVLGLAQALAGAPRRVVIVLDDYHTISSPLVTEGLGLLLEYLPSEAHVVLVTRADPALPLGRMRVSGKLCEFRADELRFDPASAASYLNDAMGLGLAEADVAALAASTEGWIAGLQLAALSMQPMGDRRAFIASFDGRHRYVIDYLTEEALASQSPEVQAFLLETSVLERLDAALCEAVTTGRHGQAMLERLDAANLFLIPLDEARRCYRYHHLFADMLGHLLQSRMPERVDALHRRAARHLDAQGRLFEAVGHAMKGHDWDWAADRIDAVYPLLQRGQLSTLRAWLEALPEPVLAERPRLDLLRARVRLTAGDTERTLATLERVERRLAPGDDPVLAAQAQALRAFMCRVTGDLPAAIALAEAALAALPPGDAGWRQLALITRALALHFAGDPARALRAYDDLAEAARAHGDAYYVIMAGGLQGTLLVWMGALRAARRALESTLAYAEAQGLRHGTSISFALASYGELLRELGEWENAERFLHEGLGYGAEMLDSAVNSALNLAKLHQSRGDADAAVAVIEGILDVARGARMPSLVDRVEAALAMRQALRALAGGPTGLAEAVAWARNVERRDAPGFMTWTSQAEGLGAARVFLAVGEVAAADTWIAHAERMGAALGQLPIRLTALVLRARLADAQSDRPAALATLSLAVSLAAPEGYVRLFLDEGAAVMTLLAALAPRLTEEPLRAYVASLLSAVDAPRSLVVPAAPGGPMDLIEPLSEREREVLALMAEGLSNQAIADRLVIALNTVKKHTASVIGKLGATNRTQAVAQARARALL